MEENKKRPAKKLSRANFNVLDAVIIVGVLFILTAVVMMIIPRFNLSAINGKEVRITYTVVLENVDESVYYKINANENVTEIGSGALIGIVSEPPESELSYEFIITEENGSEVAKKNHSDGLGMNVTVNIVATAVYKEGVGFTVDGYRIASGKEMNLRFADFSGVGYCESIKILGEA